MAEILGRVAEHTIEIVVIVTALMILVDALNVLTAGKLRKAVRGRGARQYLLASFLGSTPGCAGSYINVTLYVHGFISFGAVVGGMIATSGDEAFVMLSMFPQKAILLFALLFVAGIGFGILTDKIVKKFNIPTCLNCELQVVHEEEHSWEHFFKVHIWKHIIRKHVMRIAVWTFLAIFTVELAMTFLNLEHITSQYTFSLFFIAALIGLVPESGPHLIFVTLFANGMIPFSLLFTSSFIQDGHGLIPMLSYSVKDTMLIKLFNVIYGLSLGLLLYIMGF